MSSTRSSIPLSPHPLCVLRNLSLLRLFTPLTLFVQAHVQAKMAKEGGGGSNGGSRSDEQAVEIVCSGQVLTSRMNIGTAQRFVWKSGGEMELFFRLTG